MLDTMFQCTPVLTSGVSRVWQTWHVPWAALWRGRKNCLTKIKICDLQFREPLFCVPFSSLLKICINTAPLSNVLSQACCTSTKHYDKSVGHFDRTWMLACRNYCTRYRPGCKQG